MNSTYPVRQSQLISTWGVGQVIPFPAGDNLMICGLDAWETVCYKNAEAGSKEFEVLDARLAKRLGVTHFRKPPDFREHSYSKQNSNIKIPAVRFPRWHYCPSCGYMQKLSLYSTHLVDCRQCNRKRKRYNVKLLPVYFVAVCEKGHIEDFPFFEWVHDNGKIIESCELTLQTGLRIQVTCSCGAKKSMSTIYQDSALNHVKTCSGSRPWLGEVDTPASSCGNKLKVLQVGASNVYFPIIASSLFLPRYEENASTPIRQIVEKKWLFIDKQLGKMSNPEVLYELLEEEYGLPADQFKLAIEEYLGHLSENDALTDEEYRYQEYQAIIRLEGKPSSDFFAKEFPLDEYDPFIAAFFNRIICINKLRETRAFVGFSRIFPQDAVDLKSYRENLLLDKRINWLPAYVNRGEGIFIELKGDRLVDWIEQESVRTRFRGMLENFNRERTKRNLPKTAFDPRFVLLHTFAHILMRQLAFVSGYNITSIRERIYWGNKDELADMNGILLFTASSDSEGSLGGLVHQGRPGNLEPIIIAALQSASWCSADPICIESKGQGVDGSNLGACHNCALVPETSCEKGNRLLDRGMMLGFNGNNGLGYFSNAL